MRNLLFFVELGYSFTKTKIKINYFDALQSIKSFRQKIIKLLV